MRPTILVLLLPATMMFAGCLGPAGPHAMGGYCDKDQLTLRSVLPDAAEHVAAWRRNGSEAWHQRPPLGGVPLPAEQVPVTWGNASVVSIQWRPDGATPNGSAWFARSERDGTLSHSPVVWELDARGSPPHRVHADYPADVDEARAIAEAVVFLARITGASPAAVEAMARQMWAERTPQGGVEVSTSDAGPGQGVTTSLAPLSVRLGFMGDPAWRVHPPLRPGDAWANGEDGPYRASGAWNLSLKLEQWVNFTGDDAQWSRYAVDGRGRVAAMFHRWSPLDVTEVMAQANATIRAAGFTDDAPEWRVALERGGIMHPCEQSVHGRPGAVQSPGHNR